MMAANLKWNRFPVCQKTSGTWILNALKTTQLRPRCGTEFRPSLLHHFSSQIFATNVDLEEQKASLSFRLNGKEVLWNAEVNDDWIDAAILSNFAQLVAVKLRR
jgi:hypothetical protein